MQNEKKKTVYMYDAKFPVILGSTTKHLLDLKLMF